MRVIQLLFFISVLISIISEEITKRNNNNFGENLQIWENKNKWSVTHGIDKVSKFNESSKITDEKVILGTIKNTHKDSSNRSVFKNSLLRERIKHRSQRRTIFSRLRSKSSRKFPNLSESFNERKIIKREASKKPNLSFYSKSEKFTENWKGKSKKSDYSPSSRSREKEEDDDPCQEFRDHDSKKIYSAEKKNVFDERKNKVAMFAFPRRYQREEKKINTKQEIKSERDKEVDDSLLESKTGKTNHHSDSQLHSNLKENFNFKEQGFKFFNDNKDNDYYDSLGSSRLNQKEKIPAPEFTILNSKLINKKTGSEGCEIKLNTASLNKCIHKKLQEDQKVNSEVLVKDQNLVIKRKFNESLSYDTIDDNEKTVKPRTVSYLSDKNKLDNLDTYSKNSFINLDANCSGEAYYMDSNCPRLDYHLLIPKGASPVPLRFIGDCLSHGHDLAMDMHDRTRSLLGEGEKLHPLPHAPTLLHFLNSKVTDKQLQLNKESKLTLDDTKIMHKRYDGIPKSFFDLHSQRKQRDTQCNTLRMYRNIDGSYNNENNPTWGKSNSRFFRILLPRYADGIHSLPISVTGAELPNPRFLSTNIFSRENMTKPCFTLAVMQWGQIVAHDFTFLAVDQTENGGIECCSKDGNLLPENLQHHSCAPIIISLTDKFYAPFRQRCMNFVRSVPVANEDCTRKYVDQLNGATSFLDLSPVYDNDKDMSDSLRQFVGGRLMIEMRNGRHMMPTMSNRTVFCDVKTSSDVCFKSGDLRTNQNPQLIVLQTLLLREHNRIADALSSVNPHWSDERIFQESRRILIAIYQHITYHEWLPIVAGSEYCKTYGLMCSNDGMSYDYNCRVNPSTINSFASAAFRFLHSLVEGELKLFTPNYNVSHTLRLSNHFARPQVVESNNNFEALLRGLICQPIQRPDFCFDKEITEYLFRSESEFGMDLEAIDIQRGRDHGIPGYNAYRKICHLKFAENFDDLIIEISYNNIEKLKEIYAHVDDIDLFVGASMEIQLPESLLGPTFRCIISEQFYRSRVGDKYFYDNADFPHSFTPEQFQEIKKAKLSRLICDSCYSITEVQYNAYKVQSQKNPLIPCENIPTINFNMWREEQT